MGKKGGTSVSKGQSKIVQEETPPDNDSRKLTGVLSTDLASLCEQDGLPQISVQPLRKSEAESRADDHGGEMPSRFAVLADWQDEYDPSTLLSVTIRGWLLSSRVTTVLTEALSSYSQLEALKLWNVGLNPDTLTMVCQFALQHNMRELVLDGNRIVSQPIGDLLQASNSLEFLSMKCCGLTDSTLTELSPHLATTTSLLHLDLSCNKLSDDGAAALANFLRLNRTLLSLSLTNNRIGDRGAGLIAEILSEFPLNHNEVVMKRKLDSIEARQEDTPLLAADKSPHRSPSATSIDKRATSVKVSGDKGSKVKKGDSRKEDKLKKDDKGKKGSDQKKGSGRVKDAKGSKKGAEVVEESAPLDVQETKSPLLEAKKMSGQWYLPGNTRLVYLSLSYNNIGVTGVQHLFRALQYQQSILNPSQPEKCPYLLKLSLHHISNRVPDFLLAQVSGILENRDPLLDAQEQVAESVESDDRT